MSDQREAPSDNGSPVSNRYQLPPELSRVYDAAMERLDAAAALDRANALSSTQSIPQQPTHALSESTPLNWKDRIPSYLSGRQKRDEQQALSDEAVRLVDVDRRIALAQERLTQFGILEVLQKLEGINRDLLNGFGEIKVAQHINTDRDKNFFDIFGYKTWLGNSPKDYLPSYGSDGIVIAEIALQHLFRTGNPNLSIHYSSDLRTGFTVVGLQDCLLESIKKPNVDGDYSYNPSEDWSQLARPQGKGKAIAVGTGGSTIYGGARMRISFFQGEYDPKLLSALIDDFLFQAAEARLWYSSDTTKAYQRKVEEFKNTIDGYNGTALPDLLKVFCSQSMNGRMGTNEPRIIENVYSRHPIEGLPNIPEFYEVKIDWDEWRRQSTGGRALTLISGEKIVDRYGFSISFYPDRRVIGQGVETIETTCDNLRQNPEQARALVEELSGNPLVVGVNTRKIHSSLREKVGKFRERRKKEPPYSGGDTTSYIDGGTM